MERAAVGLMLSLTLVSALLLPDPTVPTAVVALLAVIALVIWLPAHSAARAALSTRPGAAPPGDTALLVLPSRVTDPVHHPRRPRAPGLA